MKPILLLSFIFVFSTAWSQQASIAVTQQNTHEDLGLYSQQQEKELTAILEVIDAETECFFKGDYECWKQQWVQSDHAFQAWNNSDGTFDARAGWTAVDKEIAAYIKSYSDNLKKGTKRRVIRKNLTVKFYGDEVAYLFWDQYNENAKGDQFTYSKDSRIMEKHQGSWKIAHVSSFWDYQNPVTENQIK